MAARKRLQGADDRALAFEAKDRIDRAKGSLIAAGTRSKSCPKRLRAMSAALARISSANALADMMTTGNAKKQIKRDIVRTTRTGRTVFSKFQAACLIK